MRLTREMFKKLPVSVEEFGEEASFTPLSEMAHLEPSATGLPFAIWIAPKRDAQHDLRIKVFGGSGASTAPRASVAIRPRVHTITGELGTDFVLLHKWVELNRDVLVSSWGGAPTKQTDGTARIRSVDEMVSLLPTATGLPIEVWMLRRGDGQHNVRLMVIGGLLCLNPPIAHIEIDPTVHVVKGKASHSDLKSLQKWVDLNRDTIIAYWHGHIDRKGVLESIRSIASRRHRKLADHIDPCFGDSDGLYLMTELETESTGLPFVVWIAFGAGVKHDVRV